MLPKASDSYFDWRRVPYDLYCAKYIDLVSLASLSGVPQACGPHLGLSRAPYGLNGVKYIHLVPAVPFPGLLRLIRHGPR